MIEQGAAGVYLPVIIDGATGCSRAVMQSSLALEHCQNGDMVFCFVCRLAVNTCGARAGLTICVAAEQWMVL